MILSGDIGATKCNLALFDVRGGKLQSLALHRFISNRFSGLDHVLREFLRETRTQVRVAAFGAAGPVIDDCVRGTNLPWVIDGRALAATFGFERVVLLNDLEATGYGLAWLEPGDLLTLHPGRPVREANQAIIAPGTGLGEAILFWDGSRHVVSPTEGGHADFAPRTEEEIELLRFLKKRHRSVSAEHVVSGPAFRALHEFLDPSVRHVSFDDPAADPAPEITRRAREGSCGVCGKAVAMWIAACAAEAGNLALKALARGGLYLAGGIVPKILDAMRGDAFLRAFREKDCFEDLLAQIPVHVVLKEDLPVLGAAARAASLAGLLP